MEEVAELQAEPYFTPNFFQSYEGVEFIRMNPQKPPNDEVLTGMSQRMSRSIENGTEGETWKFTKVCRASRTDIDGW